MPGNRFDIALGRSRNGRFSAFRDNAVPEGTINAIESKGLEPLDDARNDGGRERHVVRITTHKPDMALVGCNLQDVACEQSTLAASTISPVKHGAAGKVAATPY